MHSDEKLVAILGGKWIDASVDFVVVPKETSLGELHQEMEQSGSPRLFHEWLMEKANARYAKPAEVELFALGMEDMGPNEARPRT